jgi:hypothetical protein
LHADNRIEKESGNRFSITAGRVKLLINPIVEQPTIEQSTEQRATQHFQIPIHATIETNMLTAPGPPGAVDKGERQERGQKLLLSTPAPVSRARFTLRMSVEE